MAKCVRNMCELSVKSCSKLRWPGRLTYEKSSELSVLWPWCLNAGRIFCFVFAFHPFAQLPGFQQWLRYAGDIGTSEVL